MYVWIVKITRSDAAALSQLLGTPDDNSDDVARAIAWELGMQADVLAEVRDQVWSDGAELVLGAGAFRFAIALAANEKHHAPGLPLARVVVRGRVRSHGEGWRARRPGRLERPSQPGVGCCLGGRPAPLGGPAGAGRPLRRAYR
jgi:hypothetical protein